MKLVKLVSTATALLFIQACSHPIEIEGQGDVVSASGKRTCLLENFQAEDPVCSENYVIGAYSETYTPAAKPGWKFDHWVTYCQTATPPNYECSFTAAAVTVQKFWGQTMPPLKAVFTPNTAPVADAGPDQTAYPGNVVVLNGTGSTDADGDPLSFHWSMAHSPTGSAATLSDETAVNPTFTVDVPGSYVAQLIVNDGTEDSVPDSVAVTNYNSPPVANAGADQSLLVGQTATLDGSASSDVDGDSLQFSWALTSRPAGSSATLSDPAAVQPTFPIDVAGTYEAQLIVNDGNVDSPLDTVLITTANSLPVGDAGANQSVFVNDTVHLDASGSTDVDGDALTYQWALTVRPAGSAAVLSDGTAVNPTFTADVPGTYVAQVIVNDGTVESAPDTVTIETENSPPVASAGPDQNVFVSNTVQLDASGSTDVDGDTLTNQWALTVRPSGSAAVLSSETAVNPTFTADVPGTYVAQVIVNDGTVDSAPDTVTVMTENSRPVADAGADQSMLVNDVVQLDGLGSSDIDGDALAYSWSFASRPAGSSAVLSDPSAVNPTFTADKSGEYIVQLIVNDGVLDSDPDTITAATTNSRPTACIDPVAPITKGESVSLFSCSTDVDGDPLTYQWSLSSAPSGNSASLTNTDQATTGLVPDSAGTYVIQLIVSDGALSSTPPVTTQLTVIDTDGDNDGVLDGVDSCPLVGPNLNGLGCPWPLSVLNDTGIIFGGSFPSGNNVGCTGATIAQQDCSNGRDATHNDDADGHAGFSYTKLAGDGTLLPASAVSWACVRDNVTGLVWENKTDDGGIHDKDNTYRWGGKTAQGTGYGTYYPDWDVLVDGSNNEGLCGFTDWRVPTRVELQGLVNQNRSNPALDIGYFPTHASVVWSASPSASNSGYAWFVNFYDGSSDLGVRYATAYGVRLVRGGQ